MLPTPVHLVKDRKTEPSAGSQMKARSSSSGMPTSSVATTLSRRVSRIERRRRRRLETGSWVRSSVEDTIAGRASAEDVLGLAFGALLERLHVGRTRVVDEALDQLDHRGRHVRDGVAVHELRDGLLRADRLDRLLLDLVVGRRDEAVGDADVP